MFATKMYAVSGSPFRLPETDRGAGQIALADDGTIYLLARDRDGGYLYALVDGSLPKKKPTRLPHRIHDFTATPGSEPPMPQWLKR